MTLPVFVAPTEVLHDGAEVALEGDEGRHAVVVRRIRAGERILLTDGAGTAAEATVLTTTKAALTARLDAVVRHDEPAPRITVVQAIPKGERADLTVEVLTEVGADAIVPWSAARSVGVWRGDRAAKSLARWRTTAREAGKQSRRVRFPEVTDPAATAEVAALLAGADLALVLHESALRPLADLPVPQEGTVVLVVGPEGGIAEDELAAFAEAGAHVCRLGDTVLRTSTAGVAAVAAVLSRTSRWR